MPISFIFTSVEVSLIGMVIKLFPLWRQQGAFSKWAQISSLVIWWQSSYHKEVILGGMWITVRLGSLCILWPHLGSLCILCSCPGSLCILCSCPGSLCILCSYPGSLCILCSHLEVSILLLLLLRPIHCWQRLVQFQIAHFLQRTKLE